MKLTKLLSASFVALLIAVGVFGFSKVARAAAPNQLLTDMSVYSRNAVSVSAPLIQNVKASNFLASSTYDTVSVSIVATSTVMSVEMNFAPKIGVNYSSCTNFVSTTSPQTASITGMAVHSYDLNGGGTTYPGLRLDFHPLSNCGGSFGTGGFTGVAVLGSNTNPIDGAVTTNYDFSNSNWIVNGNHSNTQFNSWDLYMYWHWEQDQTSASPTLAIDYPPHNSVLQSDLYVVEYSDNFPFRFAYTVGDQPREALDFVLLSGCNSSYESCTTFDYSDSVATLDPSSTGRILTVSVVATTTMRYYFAYIFSPGTIFETVEFRVLGGSDVTLPPASINESDCNWLCVIVRPLVTPSAEVLSLYTMQIPDKLGDKIPFGYYFKLKEIIESAASSTPSNTLSSLNGNLEENYNGVTYTVPIINFDGLQDPRAVALFDFIRPFLILMIYGGLGFTMYEQIAKFKP